jgi:hypothetical protein
MKLTAFKSTTVKVLAAATLAGALLTAAAPAAEAQWHVGFRVGGPVYVAPRPAPVVIYGGPAYYGYYGHRDDWRFRHDRDYRYGFRR